MNDLYEHVFRYDEMVYKSTKLNQFLYASKEYCIAKLKEHSQFSSTLSIFQLKKKNRVFEIQKRDNINILHPLSNSLIPNQMNVFALDDQLKDIESYLEEWNIEKSKIESIHFTKQNDKISLTIMHACNWEMLDENQLRYYYFLYEIENMNTYFLKYIKNLNLKTSKKKELMNWFQKMKFEINQTIYDVLKLNNLDLQDCKLEIKDQYRKHDYVITMLVNLEKLVEKIDQRYKLCIETDFDLSSTWIDENLLKLTRKINVIESLLSPIPVSSSLKQVVFDTLFEFKSNSSNNTIALSRYNFMVSFIYNLEKLLTDAEHKNSISEKSFIEFLIEMNFNHFQFLNWLSNHFYKEVDKFNNPKEKNRYYLNQFLIFSNIPVRIRSMYNESEIALKDQLKKIIQYELKYTSFEIIAKAENKTVSSQKSKIKLKTKASVLIQLFRSLNENGFFNEATPTRLAELMAENFNTNSVERLTIDGIRNKFYSKDDTTKKELIILLQNVIASLKKD